MKSKRVAILVNSKPGTTETFINNHINKLPFQTTLIYGGPVPHIIDGIKSQFLIKSFLRFIDLLFNKNYSFEKYKLTKYLKKNNIQVVFVEYLITGCHVIDTCDKLGIPMIVTALGYDISSYSVLEKYGKMYPNMFNKCQNVIVVSNHMKIKLKDYGCPLDKVIYSPAGPEESFFNLTPSFSGNQVLSIGRFVDKKAPYLSVLAFKKVLDKISGAKLIMAGKGPLLGVVRDIVQSIGINDSVSFIGEINQEQQREFLISSSVFIQHSKVAIGGDSEGTPVAILEASAAGIPVVSTRHGGIVETVMDGQTGFLVDEGDIDEMAKAIINLLEDKDLAKKMGASGKKFIKENFSLEKHITTLANAISGN